MNLVPLLAIATASVAVVATGVLARGILRLATAEEGTVELQERRGSVWRSSGVLLMTTAVAAILISDATFEEFPPLTPIMVGLGAFSVWRGGRIRVTPPANPRVTGGPKPPPLPSPPTGFEGIRDLGLLLNGPRSRLPRRGGRREDRR